jgi:hypothetical protein
MSLIERSSLQCSVNPFEHTETGMLPNEQNALMKANWIFI